GRGSTYCAGSPLPRDAGRLGNKKTSPPRIDTLGLKGLPNVILTVRASIAPTSCTAAPIPVTSMAAFLTRALSVSTTSSSATGSQYNDKNREERHPVHSPRNLSG